MANPAKTAQQIKSQITRFSGKLARRLNKPKQKFINEMIYGIQASKDIKLASIARTLDEEIPLIKTVGRLSESDVSFAPKGQHIIIQGNALWIAMHEFIKSPERAKSLINDNSRSICITLQRMKALHPISTP